MPAVPVLVVVPLPLAAAAGQDVQAGAGHGHVALLVRVQVDQVRSAAGVGNAAGFAAAQRSRPHRLAGGTVQGRAGLLETVHRQVTLLQLKRE